MKTLAVVLALVTAVATPAVAGSPWLSVEVRPFGASTLVIRSFHHGTANPMALTGTAEGMVDGRRVSIPLRFDAIPEGNNAYSVTKSWGDTGVWVLSIATEGDSHGGAGAVVLIDRNGAATVRYPRRFEGNTRAATSGEITALLASLDAGDSPRLSRSLSLSMAARMLLPLLALGLALFGVARIVAAGIGRLRGPKAVGATGV